MAHQLMATDSMFSVKQTPWHGLGKVLANHPDNSAQAIIEAGLNWTVRLEQLSFNLNGEQKKVDRWAVVRDTDNMIVGDSVGKQWTPLQNTDAFSFFDPFVKSGEASYETAGSLQDGRRIWVLAKLNREPAEISKGDFVEKFLLLSNSHDGTLAVRVAFTPIRVVCANTLAMAHSSEASKFLRVRHTKSMASAIDKIQEITNLANESFEATAEQYRFLASRGTNKNDLRKFVKEVFRMPKEEADVTAQGEKVIKDILHRYDTNSEIMDALLAGHREQLQQREAAEANLMENILANMDGGRGVSELAPAARGSWWQAYNAVTEHLSHTRGRNDDSRLNSLWFGDSANINNRALELATAMAS